jgi:hypothetical protein
VLVCSWPLLSAQHRTVTRYTRSPGAIQAGSASALSYLQFPPDSPLGRLVPSWSRSRQRRSLYPGAMLCLLAVLGVVRARKLPPARFVRYCAFAFVLGLWLSFGTRLRFGDVRPYALTAARYLPGFAQLRSPYRAALFVQSMLVLFAGLGLDVLCRSQRRVWRVPLARVLPSLCVALALLEVTSFGVPLVRFPYEAMFEPWVAWLATQPSGAVAMVPPVNGHKASAYEGTVVGMLQSLRHGHPIVNGYSGFFPPEADQTVGLLKEFPSRVVLRGLRNRQVRYVVVDTRKLDVHAPSFTSAELLRVFDAPPRSVFALRPRQ